MLVARSVETRRRRGFSSGSGDTQEGAGLVSPLREDDRSVGPPRSRSAVGGFADRDRRAARKGEPLELAVGEECERRSVGRPEGRGAPFGPRDRARDERIDCADLNGTALGRRGGCDVGEPAPVGREGKEGSDRILMQEIGALRRLDLESDHAIEARPRCTFRKQRTREGDSERRGDEPGNPRAPRWLCGVERRWRCAAFPNPSQLARDVVRAVPPILGILGQRFADEAIERGGRHRLQAGDRRGLVAQDRGDQGCSTSALERFLTRRHLVEHGAEGEDVGERIGFLAFELLRRHVLDRSENRPFLREVGAAGGCGQ